MLLMRGQLFDKLKKTAELIALILLICVVAASCNASAENELFDMEFSSSSSTLDLENFEMTYEFGLPSSAEGLGSCLGYELDTQFGDLAVQRLADVQKELNCTVTVNYREKGSSCGIFVASSASGAFFCDAISGISDIWADVARIGMVIGLSELDDYIDYRNEEKWGYRNMLKVVYYEDDLYGVIPLLWPEIAVTFSAPIVVNEDLISQLGATDPRDYIENGEWTWDKFREVLELYFVKEGSEVKHYALNTNAQHFGFMFVRSNGDLMAEKDANGNYVPGFMSESAVKAMEEARDIYSGSLSHTIDTKTDTIDALLGGTAVMGSVNADQIISIGSRISREMDNFGILSWPTGPDVDPDYHFATHANIEMCIAFSRMSDNPEATAAIINALYEPFEGYETLDSIIEYMARSYFFDKRDASVFYNMFLASEYNYFHYGLYEPTYSWLTSKSAISEYIEANYDSLTEKINEYVLPSVRGIDSLWGEE